MGGRVFRQDQIIISLTPSCLRIATRAGSRIARVEHSVLDASTWEAAWSSDLRPFDEALSRALGRLGVPAGARADIVFAAPTGVADVHTIPARGSAALQAAGLALREVLPSGASEGWQTDVRTLLEDGGRPPRSHVMAMAERDETCETLAHWIRRTGLVPGRLLPLRSVVLMAAVRAARRESTSRRCAVIYLEEEGTVIVGREIEQTPFVRGIDFGFGTLSDALSRGSRGLLTSGESLDRVRATEILFAAGFPKRGEMMDASIRLGSDAVMPLMQPVIQRYVMEIRHTLRFGFGEQEAASADLILCGPGSAIPGIAAVLASHLEVSVEIMPGEDAPVNIEARELSDASELMDQLPSFVAPTEDSRRVGRHLRAAAVCGAAVGVVALVGSWTMTERSMRTIVTRTVELDPQISQVSGYRERVEEAREAVTKLVATRATLEHTLGKRSDWQAGFAAIAIAAGEGVELAEVSGGFASDESGAAMLTVRGNVGPNRGAGEVGTDALENFVRRLAQSPMVVSAQVVSSRSDGSGDAGDQQFTVAVRLVSASAWTLARGAHAEEGSQ